MGTLHWPVRPPFRGCNRKPGALTSRGCAASCSRNRMRRSRGAIPEGNRAASSRSCSARNALCLILMSYCSAPRYTPQSPAVSSRPAVTLRSGNVCTARRCAAGACAAVAALRHPPDSWHFGTPRGTGSALRRQLIFSCCSPIRGLIRLLTPRAGLERPLNSPQPECVPEWREHAALPGLRDREFGPPRFRRSKVCGIPASGTPGTRKILNDECGGHRHSMGR